MRGGGKKTEGSEGGARNILEVNRRELPEASRSFWKLLEVSSLLYAPGDVEMG
jgi:hypothetical protein